MELLMQPGVMAYPEFEWPFVLHMDTSSGGFGAVRYQEQGGKLRVVGYGYILILCPIFHRHHRQ